MLSSLGLGACLADDMGLGKTIQVLSLLLVEKAELPRYKTCGGGLIDRSVRAVPPEVRLPVRARAAPRAPPAR